MLGRMRRQQQRQHQRTDDGDGGGSIHGVESLIGGSGVSLDGQSLMLPGDSMYGDGDDLSSINSLNYGGTAGRASYNYNSPDSRAEPVVEPETLPVPPMAAETGVPEAANQPEKEKKMGGGGCAPAWFSQSPRWLKTVMALSLGLLVIAMVLVAVAATTAANDNGSSGRGSDSLTGGSEADVSTPAPAVPDIPATPSPTTSPTTSPFPTFPGETRAPTVTPTIAPTAEPTVEPTTGTPTIAGTFAETDAPTQDSGPSTNVVTFYATAGRFQGDDLNQLEANLPSLPTDNGKAFMVHLGDWNSPFATNCDPDSYDVVDQTYSGSSVPVYFVPGDNEYNDCPDPTAALDLWYSTLLEYETKYWAPADFPVSRQSPDYPENFAFLHENILFVGINLVGGTIHDANEWAARQAADLAWIDENFDANRSQIDLLVLFAHADPDIQSSAPFYDPFAIRVRDDYNVPTILIHRNLGIESSGFEPNFQGIDGFIVLVVEGSIWPPMKIELNAAGLFNFDQSTWYDDQLNRL